jgi:hypothetical protein
MPQFKIWGHRFGVAVCGMTLPDETHSEQLRRESDELLATAAKLIEHAEILKAQARPLQKAN